MKRWAVAVLVVLALVGVATWWLTRDDAERSAADQQASANDGVSPEAPRQSKWSEPIVARGARRLSGVVLRDGTPVSGAVVTAVEAHGEHVLSDLPCQCDNHCGQKLLQCGCPEASGQLVEFVGTRTGEGTPLGRATSASDGTFTIEGLDDSKLTLWADASNGIAWKTDVSSDAADVKLELKKGRTIKGKVTTTNDQPASGVLVTAIFSEQSRFFDGTTHTDGTFEIGPVPSGKYAVVTMQNGLLPDHKQVSDDVEDVELELSVPRKLSGFVKRDGAAVASATVKLEGMHRKRTVTTDANGAFNIEQLRAGKYDLNAEGPGALGTAKTQIKKTEDRTDVVIELEAGVPLDGVVVDEAGAPVSGATVHVDAADDWKRVETDAEGRFHFDVVSSGEREVWAKKTGFLRLERQQFSGGGAPVKLVMARAALVSGTVRTQDGTIVDTFGVEAQLVDAGVDDETNTVRFANTESTDGGFTLELAPGLAYSLHVVPRDFTNTKLEVVAPREGLSIVVARGATIRGRVFDAQGEPAAKLSVMATQKDDYKSAESDAEGRFTLGGLSPGRWNVTAHSSARTGGMWQASSEVNLSANETAEVVLRPAAGARIAGVLIDDKGAPVPKTMVSAMTARDEKTTAMPTFETATTNEKGEFSFRTMPAGKVVLRAGETRAQMDVTAPDDHVIFKLKAGTTVSGIVVDESGKPVTEFSVMHRPFEADDGRFSLPAPKGKQTMAIDAEGFAQHMFEVDVKEGANDVGTIRLSRGATMTGVVRDAETGKPIAGALIDVALQDAPGGFLLSERNGAAKTNAEGRYSIKVAPQSTWVMSTHPDYEPASKQRGSATSNVDFALKRGGVISLQVLDENGAAVKDAFAMVSSGMKRSYFEPTKNGGFEAKGLTAGKWTITVMTRTRALYRAHEVVVSATPANVTLRAEKGTVEVLASGAKGSRQVVLLNATVRDWASYVAASTSTTSVLLIPNTPAVVFPGEWTAVMAKEDGIAFQPLGELKTATQVVLEPQWQSIPPQFGN